MKTPEQKFENPHSFLKWLQKSIEQLSPKIFKRIGKEEKSNPTGQPCSEMEKS